MSAKTELEALATALGADARARAHEFNGYREVCANGTGFRPGAASLIFDDDGVITLLSGTGAPIEAFYNGVLMPLPANVVHQFEDGYVGYVVALPGEDTLTPVEAPTTLNHRIVAWVGYNPDSPDPWWYAGFELHTPYRNPDAHLLHHLETGMTWLSGGELTRVNPDDPENTRFDVADVYVADEDLQFMITHRFENYANQLYPFRQQLRADDTHSDRHLEAPILYIDVNGHWASTPGNQTALLPVYNALDAEEHGSFAAIDDGKYANYWLCFTTCQNYPAKWLMGRQQFESIADARSEGFKRLGLPTPEIVAAYRVIVEGASTATDGVKIAHVQRIARASRVDDFALTGYESANDAQDQWPLYALRRMMWTEQQHHDVTGTWMRLGGDISGYEDAYPLALFPNLVNLASGDTLITPTMTATGVPAPALVTHSSTNSPSNNAGWKAFDGLPDTSWRSSSGVFTAAGGDEWVQIDLGEARAAGYIKLTVVDSPHSPKSFALYGSNDNSGISGSWYDSATQLLAVSTQGELDVIDTTTFGKSIANHSAFRYFRLRVLSLQSSSSTGVYVAEIQLFAPAISLKSTEDVVGSCLYIKVPS